MNRYLSPGAYLPHDAPMILLEKVISVDDEQAQCQVSVGETGVLAPFLDSHGRLPGWFALELMAQTVGVWLGWHRRQQALPQIALGMVLGARELCCSCHAFPAASLLDIRITLLMQDTRFGSFDGLIMLDGEDLASARVNTFQPTAEELTVLFNQGSTL